MTLTVVTEIVISPSSHITGINMMQCIHAVITLNIHLMAEKHR
jgi:hypothetical protein